MQTRKKTYLLPQQLISKMKHVFGTKTETEAIIRAMQEISFRDRVMKWHARNRGQLKITSVYGR